MKLRVLDLFSGIGGFSLGLERTGGFETVAFCEIEEFPRKVLAKHWPGVPIYNDVRTLTADVLARDGIAVDVITGGFPCQDLSVAGKQRGMGEGTRSGLWSEIVRLVGELRPRYVIVENVAALLSGPAERRGGWFGRVLGDLAECGYDAEWENIPASALGAPHRRERVWLLAYPSENASADATWTQGFQRNILAETGRPQASIGFAVGGSWSNDVANPTLMQRNGGDYHATVGMGAGPLSKLGDGSWAQHLAHADGFNVQGQQPRLVDPEEWQVAGKRQAGSRNASIGWEWASEPNVGRVAHGVPDRTHRLAALGNAVVPAIPELIGRAILEAAE
jgi:DNA (cytosine-5)-methyltransferase 1